MTVAGSVSISPKLILFTVPNPGGGATVIIGIDGIT